MWHHSHDVGVPEQLIFSELFPCAKHLPLFGNSNILSFILCFIPYTCKITFDKIVIGLKSIAESDVCYITLLSGETYSIRVEKTACGKTMLLGVTRGCQSSSPVVCIRP